MKAQTSSLTKELSAPSVCWARNTFCLLILAVTSVARLWAISSPTLQTPANNSTGIVQHPNFSWSSVTDAVAYEIEVAADSSFTTSVSSGSSQIPRYVPVTPLSPQTKYWRVRAVDSSGVNSAWSSTFTYLLSSPPLANTYTVPAGATLTDIQAILNTAKANSPARVNFTGGATYNLNPTGIAAMTLTNASDVIIDGNGCSFVIQNPSAAVLQLDGSSRIAVQNFNVDYDPLPHFVGIIENVSGGILTLRREPGYPNLNSSKMVSNFTNGSILDFAHQGRLKPHVKTAYTFSKNTIAATSDPDVFTIALATTDDAADFAIGDPVVFWARENSQALFRSLGSVYGSDIAYYNITSYASPTGHYLGTDTSDIKVLDCHAVRKIGRWVSGNADGVHCRANLIGPWIELSSFDGIGDDSVALYNKGIFVNSQLSANSVRVAGTYFNLNVGDSFVIFNPRDGILVGSTYTVTGVSAAGTSYDVAFTPSLATTLTAGQSDPTKSDQLFSQSRRNSGFMIRNCTFDGIRRYGAVVRAIDGVISSNLYRGVSNAAVMVRNEATSFANGLFSERLLIADNTIEDCGFDRSNFYDQTGAITIRMTTASQSSVPASAASRLHKAITIRDNFIRNWDQRAISIENVDGCVVEHNTISSDSTAQPDNSYYGIYINNTTDALVFDNDLSGELRPIAASIAITANNTAPAATGNIPAPLILPLVDNSDSSGVAITGSWTASASLLGYFGTNYIYASSIGTCSVRYTPTIPTTTNYKVYLRWTASANRASNVPVDVNHAGGSQTFSLDQRTSGNTWYYLGTFPFVAGTTGNVLIRNTGVNGVVVADAVKFEPL